MQIVHWHLCKYRPNDLSNYKGRVPPAERCDFSRYEKVYRIHQWSYLVWYFRFVVFVQKE